MNERENNRKKMQDGLDAQKTQKERNVMGQFSTPYQLALDMMQYMRKLIGSDSVSFVEPSIGTGVFYSAYREVFEESQSHVLGFEIDPHYFNPTKDFWQDTPLKLRCADFLAQQPECQFDMLVANPPYVRHHHINNDMKVRLQSNVQRTTGIHISGLAGLYCYFMMLSAGWLRDGGLSCWLVPSEFMDVNYGEAVKRYLLQNVQLVRIHRFKPDDVQFTDALVSSCIVVFRNNKPAISEPIEFSIGGIVNNPEYIKIINRSDLKPTDKWTNFFTDEPKTDEPQVTLGDFFKVKRGIATGDNHFFIIDQKIIDRYEIPQVFLKPILPSPRYIKGDRIDRCGTPEEVFTSAYIHELYGVHRGSYNSLYGSLELDAPKGQPKLFVIGGGGLGIPVYRKLQRAGIPFIAGILHTNDLDYPVASALAAEVVTEQPFEPIREAAIRSAEKAMQQCDGVLCCLEQFGTQNQGNRQLLELAKQQHKLLTEIQWEAMLETTP